MPRDWSRFRSKMVKILDNWYFKEMQEDEFKAKIAKNVLRLDNIRTMDQLSEFMSEQQNETIEPEELQWRVWIAPNFENNQSIMIWKSHHVIGDGVGVLCLLGMLQDHYDPKQYIQTTSKIPIWKRALLFVLKPITGILSLIQFAFWPADKNFIKPEKINLVGKKKNAICKPFEVQKMKAIAKKYNEVTINDVFLGITSCALKEYLNNHGDVNTKTINIILPFSLRPIPQSQKELKLHNDFTGINFTLDLSTDFKDAVAKVRKNTNRLKSSIYPFGLRAVGQLSAIMPFIFGQIIMHWLLSKATLCCSNVPGPKNGLTYGGKTCHGFIALVPGIGDMAFGITGLSMQNNLYYAIQGDMQYIEEPKELQKIVERKYDELCKELD